VLTAGILTGSEAVVFHVKHEKFQKWRRVGSPVRAVAQSITAQPKQSSARLDL